MEDSCHDLNKNIVAIMVAKADMHFMISFVDALVETFILCFAVLIKPNSTFNDMVLTKRSRITNARRVQAIFDNCLLFIFDSCTGVKEPIREMAFNFSTIRSDYESDFMQS